MKILSAILGIAAVLLLVGLLIWFVPPMLNPPDATDTSFDPAQLPANGLHIATSQLEGRDNTIRVEIIANVPQRAAGFDLAVSYPAEAVRPVENFDELPASPGTLFSDAQMARNEIVELSAQQAQVRMIYVYFGDQSGAVGTGTIASIDFEMLPGAESATIELVNPRLSQINAEGEAEYVALTIGDPTLTLQMTDAGLQQAVGAAPLADQTNSLIIFAAGLIAFAILGLAALLLGRQASKRPRLAGSAA